MRYQPANVQLRRAQLVLMLAVLVPTVLMIGVGIVILAVGASEASSILFGVLVLTFCATAVTGYILGSIFLGRGALLARVQNDFLSSVSHELRTPLTSISLFIDSLRDGRLSPEQQQHVLTLLGAEMVRLDKLLVRLFDLSRMESGALVFERNPVQVADIVKDALAAFDASTLARPTPVLMQIEPGLALVGDRAMLARAVSNLLVNAWKYTGEEKRIELGAHGVGKWIEISVGDNGMGILREERSELFMEFSRSQRAVDRGTPGVGLGLAVVRAITRAHKGKVEVTSRPGEGSVFKLRLPRGRLQAAASPAEQPAAHLPST